MQRLHAQHQVQGDLTSAASDFQCSTPPALPFSPQPHFPPVFRGAVQSRQRASVWPRATSRRCPPAAHPCQAPPQRDGQCGARNRGRTCPLLPRVLRFSPVDDRASEAEAFEERLPPRLDNRGDAQGGPQRTLDDREKVALSPGQHARKGGCSSSSCFRRSVHHLMTNVSFHVKPKRGVCIYAGLVTIRAHRLV